MPINFYSVTNHLTSENWKLISTEYKNLDTELEMECPNGHKQTQTYRQWRKHPICDICIAGDPYKVKKNKVPIKMIDTQRVLALDAATGITGYSIYDDGVLVSYGTYKVDAALPTEQRIHAMKEWLTTALKDWDPDFVGLENIQLQKFGPNASQAQVKTFQTLANLQGVLLDALFEASIDHDTVYATEWRSYCGINEGSQKRDTKKQLAQDKVKTWYNQDCTQDEADAICIGKYFVHLLKNNKSSWGEDI